MELASQPMTQNALDLSESFDRIWPGNGNGGQPFEEWKKGREGLMLLLPEPKLGGEVVNWSWYWVLDGEGRMILIAGHVHHLAQGAELTVVLKTVQESNGEVETATLTAHLSPMKKGEPKE
ncbi:MAG: hypothetical protein RSA65_05045 [Clostridia bacterium]